MGYLVMLFYDERTFIYRDITVLVIFSLKLFREMSCLVFLPLGSESTSDGRILPGDWEPTGDWPPNYKSQTFKGT